METLIKRNDNKFLWLIGVLSVAIPIVVALLLFVPQTGQLGDLNVSFLPHLNAVLNSATAIALLTGFVLIRKGQIKEHRVAMLSAFMLSSIFLVSYVVYHIQAPSTRFGDLDHNNIVSEAEKAAAGTIRYVYFALLLSHIVFAAIIVPFVLSSVYFGLSGQIERHKRLSKYTFPMWLFVSVSGVIVYLMIKPYYLS
jgi:putative membrane protein